MAQSRADNAEQARAERSAANQKGMPQSETDRADILQAISAGMPVSVLSSQSEFAAGSTELLPIYRPDLTGNEIVMSWTA